VARPWPRRSAWPYLAKNGRRSYHIGFYDHDKVERTRAFPSVRHARAWMDDYVTAERRGRDSLRRFLLDLDAKEANEAEGRTIAEILELFLELDAHPRNEEGLAPSTYTLYRSVLNCHLLGKPRHESGSRHKLPAAGYAVTIASTPAERFNKPQAPRAWREQMREAGVSRATRVRAWRVLSSALSWAASSPAVPEIHTNGCKLAKEPVTSRRRSARRGGTGFAPPARPRSLASWALSPQAVEAIREQMLLGAEQRGAILAQRDATIVSLQYGLALRSQEVWGLRWNSLDGNFAWVAEVLSCGQLEQWGKTEFSTRRRTAIPSVVREDLERWRAILASSGQSTRTVDFIIPGNLAGATHGRRDPETGAVYFSRAQAKTWGRACFTPAVRTAAQHERFARILGATPYALRRGGISLRLRTEDPQTVASECGTSLKTISEHYSFPIEDLREHLPRPADIEWRAARTALTERTTREQAPQADPVAHRRSSKLPNWLAVRKRRGQAGTRVRRLAGLGLVHGDRGEEARLDDRRDRGDRWPSL
jgi:integrase